jgi:DeoR/GlpR family transcriptional regulator of sugar metabolism
MTRKSEPKPPSGRRGRRTNEESRGDRIFVFGELLQRHLSGPGPDDRVAIEYQEIEKGRHVDRRTARQICRDVADICPQVKLYERGIQVDERTYFQRNVNLERSVKESLAQRLSCEIQDHPVNAMAFGPGTSVLTCAQVLAEENRLPKVVVTNSLAVCGALSGYETSELIVTGGLYRRSIQAFVGDGAVRRFREARCEASILGVSALSIEGELLVKYPEEPEVLRQMLSSTTDRIFVVTSIEKLASRDTFPVIRIEEILEQADGQKKVTIITNSCEAIKEREKRKRAEAVVERLRTMGDRVRLVNAADDSRIPMSEIVNRRPM